MSQSSVTTSPHEPEARDLLARGWSATRVHAHLAERHGEANVPSAKALQRYRRNGTLRANPHRPGPPRRRGHATRQRQRQHHRRARPRHPPPETPPRPHGPPGRGQRRDRPRAAPLPQGLRVLPGAALRHRQPHRPPPAPGASVRPRRGRAAHYRVQRAAACPPRKPPACSSHWATCCSGRTHSTPNSSAGRSAPRLASKRPKPKPSPIPPPLQGEDRGEGETTARRAHPCLIPHVPRPVPRQPTPKSPPTPLLSQGTGPRACPEHVEGRGRSARPPLTLAPRSRCTHECPGTPRCSKSVRRGTPPL